MASRKAEALAKRLGEPWKPRVWENLGWHWEAVAKVGDLYLTIWIHGNEDRFCCAVSDIESAGSPGLYDNRNFKTPENAIRATLAVVKRNAKQAQAIADLLTKIL